jgi:hypothetical protein
VARINTRTESMRHCCRIFILAAACVAVMGCGQIKAKQKPLARLDVVEREEPPLLLDDEPLLLLDDNPDTVSAPGPVADNSRCHVCHLNYTQDDVAVVHAKANIGCADCHGQSDAHIADESWSWGGNGTAPDRMYRRTEVNPFCMSCHPKDDIDTEQHQSLFAGVPTEKYCTDCHGKHRLPKRRTRWKDAPPTDT